MSVSQRQRVGNHPFLLTLQYNEEVNSMGLTTIRCQLEGSIEDSNMYGIAFSVSIGIPVQVEVDGEWIDASTWDAVATFIEGVNKRIVDAGVDPNIYTNRVFYAGPDIVGEVSYTQLICGIARDPHLSHQLRRTWGDQWGVWTQFAFEYNFIRSVVHDVSDWPDLDKSNPNLHARSETWFQVTLGGYDPETLSSRWHGALEGLPSTDMRLRYDLALQIRHQIQYPSNGILLCRGGVSWDLGEAFQALLNHIQTSLFNEGEIYLPYIGRFHMKGTRLCFSASRLLRDRIHGRTIPAHRTENGRSFGGEKQPGQSILIWGHRDPKGFHLSRLRQLVTDFSGGRGRGNSMIVYQAFSDALIFRLTQGVSVTIEGIGTLRVNPSKRVSFRTSKVFRRALKRYQGAQIGGDNV